MNLKEFLSQNKIIKDSMLAILMWPDKKNQAKVFSNKIHEVVAGSGKQRITEDDEARAKKVLLDVAERIKAYAGDKLIVEDKLTEEKPQPKALVKKKLANKFNLAEELAKLKEPGATKQK